MSTANDGSNRRPTLGFLNYNLWHSLECTIWHGVVDVAEERDVSLICFVGDQLASPFGFRAQANVLYDLVSAEVLDGVAMFAAAMGVYLSQEEKSRFFRRYLPLPTVLLEERVDPLPCIDFDFAGSLRELLVHLIEAHGYRRIAFVRGPDTHEVAELRYRVYGEVLAERGIEVDPDLVTPPGLWDPATGRLAVQTLIDERRVALDAILAASDDIAFGVLDALREREIRVPEDIAVVGHDDIVDSKWITPPLTTVPNRAYEQGRLSIEVLLAALAGEAVRSRLTVPLKMVVRQSCGCMDPSVERAAMQGERAEGGEKRPADLAAERDAILAETDAPRALAATVVNALVAEIFERSSGVFLPALNQALRQVAERDGDIAAWQNVCSAARNRLLPYVGEARLRAQAEDLLHKARVMISETAQRAEGHRALVVERRAQLLREIEARLLATFHVEELMDILAEELPRLGVPGCYLALYEDPAAPAAAARLILAYDRAGRVSLPPGGRRFPARNLVPDGLLPEDRRVNLVAYPLYFRTHQLGFVMFEVGPRVGTIYEALRAEISSALQGALLVQRLQERTAELIREQYIINTFMESVPDEIYFKDREGRITRANAAHARRLGFSDPSEEIGLTDFDFFVAERARVKYEQEQEIIRTGIPLINIEEQERWADGRVEWTLTSKMPLRNEHGEVIGTFGISRDITQLKEVEARIRRLERDALEVQMAGGFAHEMRNALAGNRMVLRSVMTEDRTLCEQNSRLIERLLSLIEGHLPADRLDQARKIGSVIDGNERKLDRGLRLIDDCTNRALDVTALISNYAELSQAEAGSERVNLVEVAEEIVRNDADALAREGILLRLSSGAPGALVGQIAHFRTMLRNLVHNARDALREVTDERELRIDLRVLGEGGALIVSVSDTANGIAPAHLPGIFRPFFSTKPTTGVGLGLSVVAKLVSLYQGKVEVRTDVGKGTTFTLRFPLAGAGEVAPQGRGAPHP